MTLIKVEIGISSMPCTLNIYKFIDKSDKVISDKDINLLVA